MKLQPVSPQVFGDKRWQRYTGYGFAAAQNFSPLVLRELPRAMLAMPIAFIAAKAAEGDLAPAFVPVAVQGFTQGQNLFVHPNGQWVGSYVPAAQRGHPFYMASTPDGQQVLCFDTDSGLLRTVQPGVQAEEFFGADQQPSKAVASILEFLSNVAAQQPVTARACAVLQSHGLIQPWSITLKTPEGDKPLQGLFRVDEERLNQLDGAALQELQRSGALGMAYCQLLSMQQLDALSRLTEQQAQWRSAVAQAPAGASAGLATTAAGELDLEFLNQGGTLHFGN